MTTKHYSHQKSERNDKFMTTLDNINESLFESIKHINEYGQEYWLARELMGVLG